MTESAKNNNNYDKEVKEKVKTEENEIRVATESEIRRLLGYAHHILSKDTIKDLTIRSTGNAINRAVILVELIK